MTAPATGGAPQADSALGGLPPVALITPPFAAPGQPTIGVAVLAAWLRRHGVPVVCWDGSNAMYRRLLAPDHLAETAAAARDRLETLNAAPRLTFSGMLEYGRLVRALREAGEYGPEMDRLLDHQAPFGRGRRMPALYGALRLATVGWFPEGLEHIAANNIITTLSATQRFSSRQLLERSRQPDDRMDALFRSAFARLMADHRPAIVGLSVISPDQIEAALRWGRLIKALAPQVFVVLGGPYVSCHLRRLSHPGFFEAADGYALDEGETPLLALVREVASGAPDLSRVPGLIHCRDGAICANALPPPLPARDIAPPDYRVFDLDAYPLPRRMIPALFQLCRGCYWGRCAFCRTDLPMISAWRQADAGALFDQIAALVADTGMRILSFCDESTDPEVLEALCRRMLDEGLKVRWVTNLRFDRRLTTGRLRLFRQAGCLYVNLGLEAFNDRVLARMRKGITEALIEEILERLHEVGLDAVVYMMAGFPSETEAEARRGYEQVRAWLDRGWLRGAIYHPFSIAPYSDVARRPEAYGVEGLEAHPDLDLAPEVSAFHCPGMAPDQARRLAEEFDRGLQGGPVDLSAAQAPGQVGDLALRYDLIALARVALSVPPRTAAQTLDQWLACNDEQVSPLLPGQKGPWDHQPQGSGPT